VHDPAQDLMANNVGWAAPPLRGSKHVEQITPVIPLIDMRRRRYTWLGFLVVAALAVIFSYSWSGRTARSERIKVERHVSNTVGIATAEAKTGYDPYFDRVNYFGTIMLSATNAVARSR
jgi:hypothetical protein